MYTIVRLFFYQHSAGEIISLFEIFLNDNCTVSTFLFSFRFSVFQNVHFVPYICFSYSVINGFRFLHRASKNFLPTFKSAIYNFLKNLVWCLKGYCLLILVVILKCLSAFPSYKMIVEAINSFKLQSKLFFLLTGHKVHFIAPCGTNKFIFLTTSVESTWFRHQFYDRKSNFHALVKLYARPL